MRIVIQSMTAAPITRKMIFKYLMLILLPFARCDEDDQNDAECLKGPSKWYKGTMSHTREGLSCQRWDVTIPHLPKYVPTDGGHHNYCRNPDNDINGLWCYTTDPSVRWEYCNATKCHDESLLIWSAFRATTAHVVATHADPELIQPESSMHFNLSVIVTSQNMNNGGAASDFTAVTGSYPNQMVYYVDYRSNYIGRHSLITGENSQHFHGMAAKIKGITLDRITNNIYWTDATIKALFVSNQAMTYHNMILTTAPGAPCGVSIHAEKRFLFFSVYKPLGSKVIRTDTSGKNALVLAKYPNIFDVPSLVVDEGDDRVYMADYWMFGSIIFSTKLDGSDKKEHLFRAGSRFVSIASYLEYIYVADDRPWLDAEGHSMYSIFMASKTTHRTLKIAMDGEPQGVAVLVETYPEIQESKLGSCSFAPTCDHICLPRVNAERECICSVGFKKIGDTECVKELLRSNYLLVADGGGHSIFQLSMTSPDNTSLFTSGSGDILSLAINPMRQEVYWSERDSLFKSQGRIVEKVMDNVTSTAMAIDELNGYIYYYDAIKENMYVTDGTFKSAIFDEDKPEINAIKIDCSNRLLYWTQGTYGHGEVWRSNMNGSHQTIVMDGLTWAPTMDISKQRKSLLVMDSGDQRLVEIPLTSSDVHSGESMTFEYDLSENPYRKSSWGSSHVIDIKEHNGDVYFIRDSGHVIKKLSLTTNMIDSFGSRVFYDTKWLAVSGSPIELSFNPCSVRTKSCPQLCIPISSSTSVCR